MQFWAKWNRHMFYELSLNKQDLKALHIKEAAIQIAVYYSFPFLLSFPPPTNLAVVQTF